MGDALGQSDAAAPVLEQPIVIPEGIRRFAARRCAVVAGMGHAVAVLVPVIFDPQMYHAVPFGHREYPYAPFLLIVSFLLGFGVYRVVRSGSIGLGRCVSAVLGMCAAAAIGVAFCFRPHLVHPGVLSGGLVSAGLSGIAVTVNRFDVLDAVRANRTADPDDVREYLKLEATSWQSVSVQVTVFAVALLIGLWQATIAVAPHMTTAKDEELVLAAAMGTYASAYVALAAYGIIAGAWAQARLARRAILSLPFARIPTADSRIDGAV